MTCSILLYLKVQPFEREVHLSLGLVCQDGDWPLVEGVVRLQPLALGQGLEDQRGLIVPVQDHRVGRLNNEMENAIESAAC